MVEVRYDPSADAMYIKFGEGKYAISREAEEGIIFDLDEEGKLLGIEVLDVDERVAQEPLSEVNLRVLRKPLKRPIRVK